MSLEHCLLPNHSITVLYKVGKDLFNTIYHNNTHKIYIFWMNEFVDGDYEKKKEKKR